MIQSVKRQENLCHPPGRPALPSTAGWKSRVRPGGYGALWREERRPYPQGSLTTDPKKEAWACRRGKAPCTGGRRRRGPCRAPAEDMASSGFLGHGAR